MWEDIKLVRFALFLCNSICEIQIKKSKVTSVTWELCLYCEVKICETVEKIFKTYFLHRHAL